jgi:hypothetical protein
VSALWQAPAHRAGGLGALPEAAEEEASAVRKYMGEITVRVPAVSWEWVWRLATSDARWAAGEAMHTKVYVHDIRRWHYLNGNQGPQ